MKSALLFANGEVNSRETHLVSREKFDLIVAADGGLHNAVKYGFQPQAVIGDLDSVNNSQQDFPDITFVHRPSQELNDLEKSLIYCRDENVTDLTILGASGKRLDHSINNLSVLAKYDQDISLSIYDTNSQIWLVRDTWAYQGKSQQLISLIPLGKVEGVTTNGLAWELNDEPLQFGVREGLSNYMTGKEVSVSIRSGILAVFAIHREV